jgi:hypothetical protein
MFDILFWDDHTLANILFCVITYALFIALYFNRYVIRALPLETKTNRSLLFFAFFLIIMACIDGDWFHYQEMVQDYDFLEGAHNYGEPIYGYIISLVNKNYLLFRIVVWGGALVLTCFAFKRFEVNLNIALFFLIAVFLVKFNYARSTLGMASCCLGASFLIKPNKSLFLINILFAALFFWAAYEFHHSVLILVLLSIVTIYLPVDKPIIVVIVLLAMPFLASLLKDIFVLVDQLDNEYITDKIERYLDKSTGPASFMGIVSGVINYGVFAIPILADTFVISRNRARVSSSMIRLYRLIICTTILALSFAFMELESTVFIYRILFMSFIPLSILTVDLFEHGFLSRRGYSFCVLWGIFALSFRLLVLLWDYR